MSYSSHKERALDLIESEEVEFQSELWKELDITSRAGSRVVNELEDEGEIKRESIAHKGNVTYRLRPADEGEVTSELLDGEDRNGDTEGTERVRDLDDLDLPDIELSANDRRALEEIIDGEVNYQTELWKTLGIDSRTGSRVARRLEDKNIIKRTPSEYQGSSTLRLDLSAEVLPNADGADGYRPVENGDTAEVYMDLSEREEKALRIIRDEGGITQTELWKGFDIGKKAASRTARSLESKGYIERGETTQGGSRTYLLEPKNPDIDYSLLVAGDLLSPLVDNDRIDPYSGGFTEWVFSLTDE